VRERPTLVKERNRRIREYNSTSVEPEPEPEAEPPTVDGYNGQWYATINNDTWRSVCTAVGISTDRQLMYSKWIKKYFKIGNDKATCTRLFFPENRQAGAGGGLGLFLDQNLLRSSEARRLRRSSPVRACSWQRR
jgi:hypothetical protein